MKSQAIVDIQGFKIEDNKFIVKEIAILCDDQVQVLLIQPPFPFYNLTTEDRKQVKWIEKNRKMSWNDGFIPYNKFLMYTDEFLLDKTIYCKGVEKSVWIKNIFDHNHVINLEDMHCPKLLSLYEEYRNCTDIFNCIYHPTICALRNVTCLKKWCDSSKVFNK